MYFSCIPHVFFPLPLMYFSFACNVFLMYFSSISWEDVSQVEHSGRRMAGNQPAASQECFPCPTNPINAVLQCSIVQYNPAYMQLPLSYPTNALQYITVYIHTYRTKELQGQVHGQGKYSLVGVLPLFYQPHQCIEALRSAPLYAFAATYIWNMH